MISIICRLVIVLGVASALLGSAGATHAQNSRVPLLDLLEIIEVDRELVALDAENGGQTVERLELGEHVRWRQTRGRVGVVLTDRRVLAVATSSAAWQEARYRRVEAQPQHVQLGDRVALIVTSERAIGFDGGSGNLIEQDFGPQERFITSGVGENTAVVVTDRRALGLSPFVGGFFPVKIGGRERVGRLNTLPNLASVHTDRRILTFRAPTGTWGERKLQAR